MVGMAQFLRVIAAKLTACSSCILAPLLTAGLTLLLAKATGISGGFGGIIIFNEWVAAGLILLAVTILNFIIMTITWAPRVYGVKGFLGVMLLWILLANLGH